MGDNTLTGRSDGDPIPATDHNEILEALSIDHVPRNNSNAPQDIIGQLGTSLFRWLRLFVKSITLGTSSENITISSPTANQIQLDVGQTGNILIANSSTTITTSNNSRLRVSSPTSSLENNGGDKLTMTSGTSTFENASGRIITLSSTEIKLDNTAGDYLSITNDSLEMYIDSILRFKVNGDGYDGSHAKTNSIPRGAIELKSVASGTASGSVGGSLVEVVSATCNLTCTVGRVYIFGVTWQSLTGASATVRMDVSGVSQTLLELQRSDGPTTTGHGMTVAYQAAGTGAYKFMIFGQNWTTMTNMKTWAMEA